MAVPESSALGPLQTPYSMKCAVFLNEFYACLGVDRLSPTELKQHAREYADQGITDESRMLYHIAAADALESLVHELGIPADQGSLMWVESARSAGWQLSVPRVDDDSFLQTYEDHPVKYR